MPAGAYVKVLGKAAKKTEQLHLGLETVEIEVDPKAPMFIEIYYDASTNQRQFLVTCNLPPPFVLGRVVQKAVSVKKEDPFQKTTQTFPFDPKVFDPGMLENVAFANVTTGYPVGKHIQISQGH